MLQRSKPQRSSRRSATPAKDVSSEASATAPAALDAVPEEVPAIVQEAVAAVLAGAEAAATETDTAVGLVLATEETAGPASVDVTATAGPAPVVETAPPGPAPAGETAPAAPSLGAPPAPPLPETRAGQALRTMMMENPMQQATKATETMMKAAEEAAEFGRGNVEALTKATQIYFAGVQDLGKQGFAVMQGLADHAIENAKALSGVKSLQEAVQIHSTYARAAIEKSVSESAKLGETALKLTEQTFAPITARMSLAAEKITKVPAVV